MWENGKLVQTAIGALAGTAIVTAITGRWSEFLFLWVASIFFTRVSSYILFEKKAVKREEQGNERPKEAPFVTSEYFFRMEQTALDILEAQEPVDQTIILWWGLDGLQMNEDGELEWISRKKSKPKQQAGFAQFTPPGGLREGLLRNPLFDQTQSTRAQIEELMMRNAALQMQSMRPAFVPQFQQCCGQYPMQYPSYYYGGCCRIS